MLLGLAGFCLGCYVWFAAEARVFQTYLRQRFQIERQTDPERSRRELGTAEAAAPRPASTALPGEPAPGAEVNPPHQPTTDLVGQLEIPRLGLRVMVLEGVTATTLRRGAGRIPSTASPGEAGNVGIAAHRDSFFRPLRRIEKGDAIRLTTAGDSFDYEVQWTAIVDPDRVEVLDATAAPSLTLVTCYPFYYVGRAPKRFIVRAGLAARQSR